MKKKNGIVKKVGRFFGNLFRTTGEFLRKNSEVAVKATQVLKSIVESPVVDVIVTLTPTGLDNAIAAKLRKVMPEVVTKMALAHNIIEKSTVPSVAIARIVDYLKILKPEARTAFWLQFSAELNHALADGKITFAEAVILAQMAYKELYEKDEPDTDNNYKP